MSRDAAAWDRMLESMWIFFPSVAATSEGGELLELDGVIGTVTRAVPERSIANSVLYRGEDDLERALPELARAYEGAGILAWTVWVPHYHERAKRALAEAGHVLDADPEAMIASLDEVEPPRPDDPDPDPEPRREDVARVNDRAYGWGDAFARMFGEGPAQAGFTWLARGDRPRLGVGRRLPPIVRGGPRPGGLPRAGRGGRRAPGHRRIAPPRWRLLDLVGGHGARGPGAGPRARADPPSAGSRPRAR